MRNILLFYSFLNLLLLSSCSHDSRSDVQTDLTLQRPENTSFRVLSWNVNRESFFRHPEKFRALITAVDPDILLLDEVSGNSSSDAVAQAVFGLRGAADTLWNISFGAGGGYQRSVIVSRFPVRQVAEFKFIPFPAADVIDRLTALESDLTKRVKLRANLEAGLAANAALVESDVGTLLAIVVDLQCCGDDGTWEDLRREIEAKTVHQAMSRALNRLDVDGIILGGDLNLVGSEKPLQFLLQPLPSPYGLLVKVKAKHLDGKTDWTWDGRGSPFPSGQLDFLLYSANQLETIHAFIFDTETTPKSVLEKHDLDPDISKTLSDHRPIVADYRLRN